MSVSSTHPEYSAAVKRWNIVKSIVDNDAKHLIRTVDPNDAVRSDQYKSDAILTNFTRLTQEGLTGLVFRKPSKVELPQQLQYLEIDATGMQFNLDQLTQKVVGQVLETGRFGILVDFPQTNEYDDSAEKLARIKGYNAGSIINWNYTDYGNEYKLSLVVVKEDVSHVDEDGFSWVNACQYRALRLIDGIYYQEIYNEDEELVNRIAPTDYNGQFLNYIPFIFIGSENNDANVDPIPLYDLAVLNLGHYRNSADVEETSFIAGQPVPVVNIGDDDPITWNEANPGGILIGSRKAVVVRAGGDFNIRQCQPNILPQQLQKDKEAQAAAIGARLIAPPGGRETAEGARIRYGSQNSRLYIITKNVSLAFEQALWWTAVYMMEIPESSVYELNKEFYDETADPNLIAQNIMLFDKKIITPEEMRNELSRMGMNLSEDYVPPSPQLTEQNSVEQQLSPEGGETNE